MRCFTASARKGDMSMQRRNFLSAMGSLAAPALAATGEPVIRTTSNDPPRKVIVGTMMQAFWGEYPGLRNRLDQLAGFVDQMAGQSRQKYGRSLDLTVLPEVAITGELGKDAWERAVPFEGLVKEVFSRKAREHYCYIVVP